VPLNQRHQSSQIKLIENYQFKHFFYSLEVNLPFRNIDRITACRMSIEEIVKLLDKIILPHVSSSSLYSPFSPFKITNKTETISTVRAPPVWQRGSPHAHQSIS
jgi:hypothetical protein